QQQSTLQQPTLQSSTRRASFQPAQAQGSPAPGVNYCGPGNSHTNSLLRFVNVPQCLNTACFEHDNCYGVNCITAICDFSPQSQACDDPLIATCEGQGGCSLTTIFTSPMAIGVCTIAECLNGTFPDPNCLALRLARLVATPQCNQPASLATCGLACA